MLMHSHPTIISSCFVFKPYPLNNTRDFSEGSSGFWVDSVLVWMQAQPESMDYSSQTIGVLEALEDGQEVIFR